MTSPQLTKRPETQTTKTVPRSRPAFKLHLPLVKVIGATVLAYAVILLLDARGGAAPLTLWSTVSYFGAGVVYTHFFEYFYHKIAMHGRINGLRDRRHLEHHRIFVGQNFQSRDPEDLREITTQWYIYPVLLSIHYLVFVIVFPFHAAPAFFLGTTCQFLAFETTHWFTHVKDNAFDKVVAQVPIVRAVRVFQIKHHEMHHAVPTVNFNFTPPYGGDRLCRTFSPTHRHRKARSGRDMRGPRAVRCDGE